MARWWDGGAWTAHVQPMVVVVPRTVPDGRAVLPFRAVGYALVAVVVAALVGSVLAAGASVVTDSLPLTVLAGQVGLWGVLVGTCALVSRRYGTGHPFADLGARARWVDLAIGFGVFWAARIAVVVVLLPIIDDERLVGSNTGIFREARSDVVALVVVSLVAAVGAPLVEELFFRGLLLQALRARMGPAAAVTTQAVLFALAHVNPYLGLRNVSVLLSITAVGVVFGTAAHLARRLGPTMVAHALFNLSAIVLLLATQ